MVTVEGDCDEAARFISWPCELLSEATGLVVATDVDAPISAVDIKSDVMLSEGESDGTVTVVVVARDTDTTISFVDANSNVTSRLSEVGKTVIVVDTDSKALVSVADTTSAVGFSGRDTTVLVVGKTDNT